MKRIINIVIDFSKTHKKPLVIFTSALISLGVICGIFIYNNGVQNKKEKELLSRIDNLEEQIKKEEELPEKDGSDTNSTDINSNDIETGKSNTSTNENGGSGTQSNSPTTDKKEETTSGSTNSSGIIETDALVVLGSDGIKGINYGRFGECLTVSPLTVDNWRNYIDMITYDVECILKDAFGEVISSTVMTRRELVIKTNAYHYIENCRIELKNIETQETKICTFPTTSERWGPMGEGKVEELNLNDYECTRITGKIYFVNLPKEVIYTPLSEWDYACGFMIIGSGLESPYEIQKEIKRIYPNGTEDWEEKYMK